MIFEKDINCVLTVKSRYAVFLYIKIYNSELLRLRLGKFLHGVSESADLLYDNSVDKKDKEVDLAPDDIKGYVMQRKK